MKVGLINKYGLQHTGLNLQYWDNVLKCSVIHVQHAYQFGLFVHPFSHIRNIGHVNYTLHLYLTTQLVIYGHPPNIIQ